MRIRSGARAEAGAGAVENHLAFPRAEVKALAREYEIVAVHATLEVPHACSVAASHNALMQKRDPAGLAQVGKELSRRICIACREHSHISPLLLMPPYIA